jgi:hypothetical protein
MKIIMLTDIKLGSRVRMAGSMMDVDTELGNEMINSGQAEESAAPKKKRKRVI